MLNKSYYPMYVASLAFLYFELRVLGLRVERQRKMGPRTARLIATFTAAVTVIPAAYALGWFIAILITFPLCLLIYVIFLGVEKLALNTSETQKPKN